MTKNGKAKMGHDALAGLVSPKRGRDQLDAMWAGFALALVMVGLIIAAVCTCRFLYNRFKKKDDNAKIQNIQIYSNDVSAYPTSVELPSAVINNGQKAGYTGLM